MLRTPKADENVVIYETRKNRVSGSHTQVIDLRPQGGKYALVCVTHGTQFPRNVRLATEAESHKSHMWCPECTDTRDAEIVQDEQRAQVTVNLDSTPEEVAAFIEAYAADQAAKVEAAKAAVEAKEAAEAEEARIAALPSVESILEAIKNATSRKTCLERVEEAGL
jgi:hypothetical protein